MKDTDDPKDVEDETPEETPETEEEHKKDFDVMKLLNDPALASMLGGCKDLFKKEKSDPDVCEITIKAPSAVILKLFNLSD